MLSSSLCVCTSRLKVDSIEGLRTRLSQGAPLGWQHSDHAYFLNS